jgi:hypothetical protein
VCDAGPGGKSPGNDYFTGPHFSPNDLYTSPPPFR